MIGQDSSRRTSATGPTSTTDIEPPVLRVGELEGGVDALTDYALKIAVFLRIALAVPRGEGVNGTQRRLGLAVAVVDPTVAPLLLLTLNFLWTEPSAGLAQ